MEKLKKLKDVCVPDERMQHLVVFDNAKGAFRQLMLQDLYAVAEATELNEGVPVDIRSHFETARNLFVYSWFFYPFNVAAQLQAFASAEFALKTKAGSTRSAEVGRRRSRHQRPPGFAQLLKTALAQGWISDQGFSHFESWRLRGISRVMGKGSESPEVKSYTQTLVEVLPCLRNDLAHGSTTLHYRGAEYLGICAELINQLFEAPPGKDVKC